MVTSKSIIGGIAGWILGGPIGAGIGAAIGEMISPDVEMKEETSDGKFTEVSFSHNEYCSGIRGLFINVSAKVVNRKGSNAIIFCYFRNEKKDKWIKALSEDFADDDGDLVTGTKSLCNSRVTVLNERIFLPYGILDAKSFKNVFCYVFCQIEGDAEPILFTKRKLDYYTYDENPREGTDENSPPILEAILAISAIVIKADGIVKSEEVRTVKNFVSEVFGDDHEATEFAKETLKNFLNNPPPLENIATVINQIETQAKISIVALLLNIAASDGSVPPNELEVINDFRQRVGINNDTFSQMSKEFLPRDEEFMKILGISRPLTSEKVRNAYREKCKEFHPDKYQGLPPSFQEFAKVQFQKVQEAYEELIKNF